MSVKVMVVNPQAQMEIIETDCVYRGDCSKLINPTNNIFIEMVWVNDDKTLALLVDEDGLPKELPLNFFIPMASNPFHPVQAIVGTVLFVRFKPVDPNGGEIWDYELESVTDGDINRVKKMLSPEVNAKLHMRFVNGESGLFG